MEHAEDGLVPVDSSPYFKIAFKRKINEASPYELVALEAVKRTIYEIYGPEILEGFVKEGMLSSHYMSEQKAKDLSVIFKYSDVGGSDTTNYYALSLKRNDLNFITYALSFYTDLSGSIFLTTSNTETGYRFVVVRENGTETEYVYSGNAGGYIKNTAEMQNSLRTGNDMGNARQGDDMGNAKNAGIDFGNAIDGNDAGNARSGGDMGNC